MTECKLSRPLIILGLDAGDPRFIEKWAAEGALPVIASIMERGGWARTGGRELVAEHGAWMAISTGVSRGEHGFYSYRQLVPGCYEIGPVLGHEISPPPFWSFLDSAHPVAVVDVPDAPICSGVPGVQIQDWATHYAYGEPPRGEPDALLREVQRRFGRRPFVPEKPVRTEDDDRELLSRMLERIRLKGEMLQWLLQQGSYACSFIVFADSHTGGHQLWGRDRKGPEDLREAMKAIYQAIDREIGRILERYGNEANVIVLSSLGLKGQYPTEGLGTEFLRLLGLQPLPEESNVPHLDPLGWLRKVLGPDIRRMVNRVLPPSIQERLVSQKFSASADWARTRMFCIPAFYAGLFRVNLKGREPQGIVEPGREYDDLLAKVESELSRLIDPKTGNAAVRRISRTCDLFGMDATWRLPDLFIEWAESDHFMDRLVHPLGEIHQTPGEFHRDSDHSSEGFMAAAGPDVGATGEMQCVEICDLAPTFLHLMGKPTPDQMSGQVLTDWIRTRGESCDFDLRHSGGDAMTPDPATGSGIERAQ